MRDGNNIREVEHPSINWMGFIFYPKSSRYVSSIPEYLPRNIKRVGVFVNENIETVIQKINIFRLDLVQLHGGESPDVCNQLQKTNTKVIKAFSIGAEFPSNLVRKYGGCCDYFLFDTKTEQYGGSGRKFNWDVLSGYQGETPFLLSGGISAEDVEEILQFNHPRFIGIDINSRFETKPAIKNSQLIKQFIEQIK